MTRDSATLREHHISQTVREYLELRGWRPIRINAGPFGKAGMPDFLFLHYRRGLHLWIEFKGPRGRLGKHQAQWIEQEQARGARVEIVNDIDAFFKWYEQTYGVEGQMRLDGGEAAA